MAISIKNRDVTNFNQPDARTGKPKADQYLDFVDDSGMTQASLLVPADGGVPTFTVDSSTLTQTVYSTTVTLTNAQIKALPTTAVEIVSAPGAGLALQFQHAVAFGSWEAAEDVYTNVATAEDGANQMGFFYGDEFGNASTLPNRDVFSILLGSYSFTSARWGPYQNGTMSTDFVNFNIENQPIILSMHNANLGNLTGGNAANLLSVRVYYTLEQIP